MGLREKTKTAFSGGIFPHKPDKIYGGILKYDHSRRFQKRYDL